MLPIFSNIKVISYAAIVATGISAVVWVNHLRSEVDTLSKEVVILESRLTDSRFQYESLEKSCLSSVKAVEDACIDNMKTKAAATSFKNELKTSFPTVKTPFKASETSGVIGRYHQRDFNGSEGLETASNGDNNEEGIASLDDRLDGDVLRVLNSAYCSATGGGDSCKPSNAVQN